MAHPELEDVLRRRALPLATDVGVHVYEARHHVVTGEIDLLVALPGLGAPVGIDRHAGVPDAADSNDAVLLDHDVDWPGRGGARSIDQGRVAQDQAVVRPPSFGPIGRILNRLGLALGVERRGEGERGE